MAAPSPGKQGRNALAEYQHFSCQQEEENTHPLPGPAGTGTHTHNNSNQKFQAFKNFDPLERSKMEELLKAMISWERQEFKSGQIEE